MKINYFLFLALRLPLGCLWGVLLVCVWWWLLQAPDPEAVPHYVPAVGFFCLAALTELLAEPLWVLAHAHMLVRLKASESLLHCLYFQWPISHIFFYNNNNNNNNKYIYL